MHICNSNTYILNVGLNIFGVYSPLTCYRPNMIIKTLNLQKSGGFSVTKIFCGSQACITWSCWPIDFHPAGQKQRPILKCRQPVCMHLFCCQTIWPHRFIMLTSPDICLRLCFCKIIGSSGMLAFNIPSCYDKGWCWRGRTNRGTKQQMKCECAESLRQTRVTLSMWMSTAF